MLNPTIVKEQDFPELHQQWMERSFEILKDVHINRRKQWASGRVALSEAFRAIGVDVDLLKCHFEGHQKIKELSEWRFSLSNMDGYAGALVVPENSTNGLGLDIESATREVREEVLKRISNSRDIKSYSAIEKWCVKEAAYKTLPSEVQKKVWLNNICVLENTFKVDGFAELNGAWRNHHHSDLVVVVAQLN